MEYLPLVGFHVIFFIFFILPIIIAVKERSRQANQNNKFVIKNIVTEKQINRFVKKHFPDWKWEWTTVGMTGLPQILLIKKGRKGSGYKYWRLLQQEQIKNGTL